MTPYNLLSFLFIVFLSCSGNNGKVKIETETSNKAIHESDAPELFDDFNARFHGDSSFQLSRISFPIGGYYKDGEASYKWTAKNWRMMKETVKETVDKREYKHSVHKTDTSLTEKYWIDNSGFKIERRFEKKNGKWFLIYYEDIEL
jgi:hypothetical protein